MKVYGYKEDTMIRQEQCAKEVKELKVFREQIRTRDNIEGMEQYMDNIHVGDCISVKCDGPGSCTGRVRKITNEGITISYLFNERVTNRFIEWRYIRAKLLKVNAYADLVQKAIKKHGINKIKGKKCIVRTNQTDICGYRDKEAVEAVCGTVSRILTDAIIINTDSGEEVCILMIDIKSIDEAWEVHKSVSEELCNDMIEYNSRCSSNTGNIENREGDLKTVTGFSAVDED
jgi:hypothetical protein